MDDQELKKRKTLRLKNYDYSSAGAYFITICTNNHKMFFRLESIKNIVLKTWSELTSRFPTILLDEYVIMPNHVHGVIILRAKNTSGVKVKYPSLGEIIRTFKAVTTRFLRKQGVTDFAWQRNYYEHIIRDEKELERIREYIVNNPLRWELDRENPTRRNTKLDESDLLPWE